MDGKLFVFVFVPFVEELLAIQFLLLCFIELKSVSHRPTFSPACVRMILIQAYPKSVIKYDSVLSHMLPCFLF